MKKLRPVFSVLIVLMFVSFTKPVQQNSGCAVLSIEKVKLGYDTVKAGMFKDTINMIYITMKNISRVRLKGPDYCLLSVIYQNKTIASCNITGLPEPHNPRLYRAECKQRLKKIPDINSLRFSLQYYCDSLRARK